MTLTSPPMIGLIGRIVQILKGVPHVNWCMDIFPDGFIVNGIIKKKGVTNFLLSFLNRVYIKKCNAIFVLSAHMRERIKIKGADEDQIYIVPVWANSRRLGPVEPSDNWFVKKFS